MMHIAKSIIKLAYHQARNLGRLARQIPLITPSLGSMTLDEDDVQLAQRWLERSSDWYSADEVKNYEAAFAVWNGSKYAYSFMGGRVALSACIHALGLQPGDEVIVPGYTCVVVPNAFNFAGVRVVYSDIELDTYGLDVTQLESKITANTRAILLQHLYGLVCRDYEAILDLAQHRGLKVIEDCAHATGAEYKGKKVGNYGDVAFYSSEQSKVFNTIQGGMAVANDDPIGARLTEYYEAASYPDKTWIGRQLCNVVLNYYQFKHPQRWWLGDLADLRYGDKRLISITWQEECGLRPPHYERRMPAPIASLGLNQLKKIDEYNDRRRQTARRWDRWCETHGYQKPRVVDGSVPVYLRYPVLVSSERKRHRSWAVKELGVSIGVWFVSHIHPDSGPVEGCPRADQAVSECINFPGLLE